MTASAGRNFILQMGDAASPEVFTAVGAIKTNKIAFDNTAVDVTTMDSAGIRQLLAGAGVRSASITFDGIFTDTTKQAALMTAVNAGTHHNFKLLDSTVNNVTISGKFQVTAFELAGAEGDAMTFSGTLESAGTVTIANS